VILVVGPGAVGTFLGATLAAGGRRVTLLGRGGASDSGSGGRRVTVVGPAGVSRTADVASAASAEAVGEPPELIVMAVKMYDLAAAIETIGRWPAAPVLAVENGIGADEQLVAGGRTALVAGSLTTAVELDRSSRTVERRSRGGIALAPVAGQVGDAIDGLVTAFEAGGLRARRLPEAPAMRWSKLLANLLGNATSAIVDLDPADVYRDAGLFAIEMRQLRETLAIMRALAISPVALPGSDVRLLALAARLPPALVRPVLAQVVARGRGGKSPSLRRYLDRGGGPSEAMWLNGAVARAAHELGRRAPVNERLAAIVTECGDDADRRAWYRGRPDRLVEAVGAA
jgi:2-dehydropantoate 2-reductase